MTSPLVENYTQFFLLRNGPTRKTGEIWAILRKKGEEINVFYWKFKKRVHKASLVRFSIVSYKNRLNTVQGIETQADLKNLTQHF